jgi:chromosome segregation ATPase
MVAINSDKIEALRGGGKSIIRPWDILLNGEFYLIFIFGMLPLFITHHLINLLSNAYKKSKKELLDLEKSQKLNSLNKLSIDLSYEKESLIYKVDKLNDSVRELELDISHLESDLNDKLNSLETRYSSVFKQIKDIFSDYNTKVASGKIFTDVILMSIISAFKTGFIDFLPEFYAEQEVSIRVREIESEISKIN